MKNTEKGQLIGFLGGYSELTDAQIAFLVDTLAEHNPPRKKFLVVISGQMERLLERQALEGQIQHELDADEFESGAADHPYHQEINEELWAMGYQSADNAPASDAPPQPR